MSSSSRPKPRRTTLKIIGLTPDELAQVQRQALAVGLPVSAYLRDLGLGRPLQARRKIRDQAGIVAVSRIGNNLMQLAAVARRAGSEGVARALGSLSCGNWPMCSWTTWTGMPGKRARLSRRVSKAQDPRARPPASNECGSLLYNLAQLRTDSNGPRFAPWPTVT